MSPSPHLGDGLVSFPGSMEAHRRVEEPVAGTLGEPCPGPIPTTSPGEPFQTESGAVLPHVEIAYETWGRLSPARDNVVLVAHALTGDAHAASHDLDDEEGWWEAMIGPGRAIDTDRFYVICSNVLGGCGGSTGPRSIDPLTGERYDLRFPPITVRDIVAAQARLLDLLGIERLYAVIGGSLGGMQALEWAVTYPNRVQHIIPIATSAQFSAQGIAFNEVQRRAIMLDPAWRNGNYEDDEQPRQGLAVARMLGMITYQSDELMTSRFGRNTDARYTAWPAFHERFDVEGYLHYQGDKLGHRFDANSYLYLSRAMDSHDIARGRGTLDAALARIEAATLMVGIRSDVLFPAYQAREVAERLARLGRDVRYYEMDSPKGHDAFLNDIDKLAPIVEDFLA